MTNQNDAAPLIERQQPTRRRGIIAGSALTVTALLAALFFAAAHGRFGPIGAA